MSLLWSGGEPPELGNKHFLWGYLVTLGLMALVFWRVRLAIFFGI